MFRQVPLLALLWSDDAMTKRKSTAPTMASRLELWPLERLKPFERNARTHSEQQLRQMVASIQQFGFTAPILVDGQDGILAGHGRLEAARRLGLAQVPVVVLDHLTPEQRRAYVIADNRLAENAVWDLSVLQAELEALRVEDFDLDALGWSDDALARLQDDLDLGSFEGVATAAAGTERAEPEDQEGLGLAPAGDDDEDADATAESGQVEERHVFSVNLLWDDRESLLAAVRMAKERWSLEGTPEALVAICREWMDGRESETV
jgi:ParB-like chromosome segregation protein Spo0J